jgi:hypothetical protein
MEENDFAAIWLTERGNPAVEELAAINLAVATTTSAELTTSNFGVDHLAVALDINPDEISRWLMGKHTFSMKIIREIQEIMGKFNTNT